MFSIDLLVAFVLMSALFVRQIIIFKQPSKINYAPIILGIGLMSSLLHFVLPQETFSFILLLKESFIPIIVALFFYMVISIFQQTQLTQEKKLQTESLNNLTHQFLDLKDFVYNLETRIVKFTQENQALEFTLDEKTKLEFKNLAILRENQDKFMLRFDELDRWQKHVSKTLDEFTHIEMPEFDSIVHKHIDLLRVAEQDHFNKLEHIIKQSLESKIDITKEIDELKEKIFSMKGLSDEIAKSITRHTLQQLSDVTKDFESQVISLKAHTEGVKTSLHEGENTLGIIKEKSEMIMKQMRLSSEKMQELQEQNQTLSSSYGLIKELIQEVEFVKKEYIHSRVQLSSVVEDFKDAKNTQIQEMEVQLENLTHLLSQKIEESIAQLREHYHIADSEVAQSVHMLSQKTKLIQGYTEG